MWVARDKSGILTLFISKPVKVKSYPDKDEYWDTSDIYESCITIDKELFPELTFEDGPIEVKLISEDKIDDELNTMFCNLCIDYGISDTVADKYIECFKNHLENVNSER